MAAELTPEGKTRRTAQTVAPGPDSKRVQALLRLLFWWAAGGFVASIILATVCAVLALKLQQAVAERDAAYAHADTHEASANRAQVRAGDLDVKLAAAQVKLQLLSEQVSQLKAELNAREQASAEAATRAPTVPRTAENERSQGTSVPVQIAFNRAANGNLAGIFTNVSKQHVSVTLEVATATNARHARFALELPAGGRREIGPADGWQFARGDKISASSKGFATLNLEVQ
jgi:hypothetical protein